jgi:hypothetical protein
MAVPGVPAQTHYRPRLFRDEVASRRSGRCNEGSSCRLRRPRFALRPSPDAALPRGIAAALAEAHGGAPVPRGVGSAVRKVRVRRVGRSSPRRARASERPQVRGRWSTHGERATSCGPRGERIVKQGDRRSTLRGRKYRRSASLARLRQARSLVQRLTTETRNSGSAKISASSNSSGRNCLAE